MCLVFWNMSDLFLPAWNPGVLQCFRGAVLFVCIARSFNTNRSLGFVKLRAYAWQIALRPAEGVAGYGEAGRKDRWRQKCVSWRRARSWRYYLISLMTVLVKAGNRLGECRICNEKTEKTPFFWEKRPFLFGGLDKICIFAAGINTCSVIWTICPQRLAFTFIFTLPNKAKRTFMQI